MNETNEPVAWAVTPRGNNEEIDCEFVYPSAATAGDVALSCNGVVVPLYLQQQPTLTDKEWEQIKDITQYLSDHDCDDWVDTLRGVLNRLG
jgi:hypothetical protein